MILILCSVSDKQPNDSVANGLVHFLLKAKFQDAEYVNAVFHRESRRMELIRRGQSNTRVIPMEDLKRSMRLACVSRLLAMMNTGDQLWTCELSDLADSAEDACRLYFSFLKKGIELKFFDASYLDTDLLKLNSEPPADQKLLIQRIIQNYYDNPGGMPSGTKERSSDSGSADSVKKKPHRARLLKKCGYRITDYTSPINLCAAWARISNSERLARNLNQCDDYALFLHVLIETHACMAYNITILRRCLYAKND